MDQRQPPTLPEDPLREIVVLSDDVETVIRCAAVSKDLRRAILEPAFVRRLGLRAAPATGGFNPDLLLSVSYRPLAVNHHGYNLLSGDYFAFQQTAGKRIRFDTNLLRSFQVGTTRDGLFVLRRNHQPVSAGIQRPRVNTIELLVCNTITGHATSIPRMDNQDPGGPVRSNICPPALLSTGGRSFELLVMYEGDFYSTSRETQIFSSERSQWGAARKIQLPYPQMELVRAASTMPAVVGRIVHWIACKRSPEPVAFSDGDLCILSIHHEAAQAAVIELPQGLFPNITTSSESVHTHAHHLVLAATPKAEGGKGLSIIAAENLVISVWTLLPDEGSTSSWSREVVIRRAEIGRQIRIEFALDAYQPIRFNVFGERSGTVLYWMRGIGLVQLNLGTKKALLLWNGRNNYLHSRAFLHEIDLVSLLECMKSF